MDYNGYWYDDCTRAFYYVCAYEDLTGWKAASGLDANSLLTNPSTIFASINFTQGLNWVATAGTDPQYYPYIPEQILTVATGEDAHDKGVAIDNINDSYEGTAPDLGWFGRHVPHGDRSGSAEVTRERRRSRARPARS